MSVSYNTVAGIVRQLQDDGWTKQNGSRIGSSDRRDIVELVHPRKSGKITIVGPDEQILGPKAIASILTQAGIVPR